MNLYTDDAKTWNALQGHFDTAFPAVLVRTPTMVTWRGVGQFLPRGELFGTAQVLFLEGEAVGFVLSEDDIHALRSEEMDWGSPQTQHNGDGQPVAAEFHRG